MKTIGSLVLALICGVAMGCGGDDASSPNPDTSDAGSDADDGAVDAADSGPDLTCPTAAGASPKIDPVKIAIESLNKTVEVTVAGAWRDKDDPSHYVIRMTDGNDRCDKFNTRQITVEVKIPWRANSVCGLDPAGTQTSATFTYDTGDRIVTHPASGDARFLIEDLPGVGGLTKFKLHTVAPSDATVPSTDTADGQLTVTVCD